MPTRTEQTEGVVLAQATWQAFHNRLMARTSVREITGRGLRLTDAMLNMIEFDAHPGIVPERLGHRFVRITFVRYLDVSLNLPTAAAEALDKRLFGDTRSNARDAC